MDRKPSDRRTTLESAPLGGSALDQRLGISKMESGGWTRVRTGDTRIFSPLLYQLSYPAISGEGRLFNRLPVDLTSDICRPFYNDAHI